MKQVFNLARLFFLITFLLISFVNTIYAQDFLVEEDLRLSWVFYDEEQNVMLPFLDNSNEQPVAIHLSIDKDYGNEAYLMLEIPEGTSLLIGDKFITYFDENTTQYYSLDSIQDQFNIGANQLTLYNKHKFQNPARAKVGFIHKTFDSSINVNPISSRDADRKADFLKLIILLIFTFFVVLYTLFPSDLFEFFSIQTLLTFRYTETAFIKYRSLTKTQTLVIIYQAALLGGILIIYLNYYNNPFGETFFMRTNPLIGWFIILTIVLIFIFLKFVLISIVSVLFKVSEKINFYLIEFLRMAMIFYSVIFIILSFAVINHFYVVGSILDKLVLVVVIFNLVRFIILFFKFRRTVTMKSLHLFSYLCTTELIPMILGLKFFLK